MQYYKKISDAKKIIFIRFLQVINMLHFIGAVCMSDRQDQLTFDRVFGDTKVSPDTSECCTIKLLNHGRWTSGHTHIHKK